MTGNYKKYLTNFVKLPIVAGISLAFVMSAGAADDPINIGANIEISGGAAVQGQAYRCALKMTEKQINDGGGVLNRPINVIIRDNKSNPASAVQIAKQLIDRDKVVGIIGGGTSPTTMSMLDTVESAGIPTLSMGSADAIVEPVEERRYLYKTPPTQTLMFRKAVEDMTAKGIKKAAFIGVDNPYGASGLQAFSAEAKAAGIEVSGGEKFQATGRDYSSLVTRVLSTNPEAIAISAIPPGSSILAKNIHDAGYEGLVYYDSGAGAELFIEGAGSAAEGMLIVTSAVLVAPEISGLENTDKIQSYYQEYSDACGSFSGFASYASDGLEMLVGAIERADTTEPSKVNEALQHTHFVGATGVFNYTPEDHAGLTTDELVIVTVKDDAFTLAN